MPLGIPMMSWECHCYLAYYHKLSMMSSKHEYILMSLSKIKMSARESSRYSGEREEEEEEELVRRVGGRGQNLVQAVLRVRRERVGRTLPNWLETQNNVLRPVQEVGPHGQEEKRRLGGFQTRGMRLGRIDNGSRTDDMHDNRETDRPRCGRWARARPSNPPPTPRQPYDVYTPPVGHFIGPHRCPHCENIPNDIFPLPPYSVTGPDPLSHYDDLFPLGYTPFPCPNTHLCPSFNTLPNILPPTPSFPLDQPTSYDSLFTTAAPSDSDEAPQISQIIGITLICGTQTRSQTGTCSSSPPVHPPYLIYTLYF